MSSVDEEAAPGGRAASVRDVHEGHILRPVRRRRGPEHHQTNHREVSSFLLRYFKILVVYHLQWNFLDMFWDILYMGRSWILSQNRYLAVCCVGRLDDDIVCCCHRLVIHWHNFRVSQQNGKAKLKVIIGLATFGPPRTFLKRRDMAHTHNIREVAIRFKPTSIVTEKLFETENKYKYNINDFYVISDCAPSESSRSSITPWRRICHRRRLKSEK